MKRQRNLPPRFHRCFSRAISFSRPANSPRQPKHTNMPPASCRRRRCRTTCWASSMPGRTGLPKPSENTQAWTNFAESLLRAQHPERALGMAERAIEIAGNNQMAIALWSLALRRLGDPREQDLNEYESMVQVFDLPPPEGYSSMEAFNRDLNAYLDPMHRDTRAPLEQTLRAGTQNHDNLIGRGHEPVERLRLRIDEALQTYVSHMKESADHPLFRRRSRDV